MSKIVSTQFTSTQYGPNVVFILVGGEMSEPHTKRPLPDSMYTDVPTVTKTASAIIFALCLFSLVLGYLTNFFIIQPFVSVLISFSSIVFFIMGVVLKKEWSN